MPNTITLSDTELWSVINGLKAAADQYQQDAETSAGNTRQIFTDQASESLRLADKIEREAQ